MKYIKRLGVEDEDYGVDCDFSRKVKSLGKTINITSSWYYTSMRKFEKKGTREIIIQTASFVLAKFGITFSRKYEIVR